MKITTYGDAVHPEMGEVDVIIECEVYGGDEMPSRWSPGWGPDVNIPDLVTVDGTEFDGAQISRKCLTTTEDEIIEDALMEYAEAGGNHSGE